MGPPPLRRSFRTSGAAVVESPVVNSAVVIAANPYEAELCRRALADTGLRVEVAEGGDGALEMVSSLLPIVLVVCDGLFCAEARELLQRARETHPALPLFFVGDREGDVGHDHAAALGARRVFLRPIEIDAFADAVEKLAVEAELASEVAERLAEVRAEVPIEIEPNQIEDADVEPPPARAEAAGGEPAEVAVEIEAEFEERAAQLGRIALKRVPREQPIIELPIRRSPTEVILPTPVPQPPLQPPPASIVLPKPGPIPAASSAEGILRADEALAGDMMAIGMTNDFVVREVPRPLPSLPTPATPPPGGEEERSTFARRLDRELSAAERRLFPDSTPSAPAMPIYDEYDDALGDIDLDSLGIDTLPGIASESLDRALNATPREAPSEAPGTKVVPPRETPSGLHQLASQRAEGVAEPARAAGPIGPLEPIEEEGSLVEVDLVELLATLHATGWTGRCVLRRGDGEKAIYFDAGIPVFATSTLVNDRLGDLLYREGKLTREQHVRTRELSVEPGRRTATLFVELGYLKSRELFPTLRRHVEEIIYSCFAWDAASYRLERDQANAEDKLRLSLHPWALCMEGVRRKYGFERLVERVGPPETVLSPTTALDRALVDCELTQSERVAAELLDGERSLADVMLAMNGLPGVALSEPGLYALSWSLIAVGAARRMDADEPLQDRLGVRAVSTLVTPLAAQARERRAKARAEVERPVDRTIDRDRVTAKRAQIGDCDYFAVLGVERDASEHEIQRAFDRLRADFARERFADSLRSELGSALDEIHEVLEEAYRVLIDAPLRQSYRSHLAET
jgi:hypothetical protein